MTNREKFLQVINESFGEIGNKMDFGSVFFEGGNNCNFFHCPPSSDNETIRESCLKCPYRGFWSKEYKDATK